MIIYKLSCQDEPMIDNSVILIMGDHPLDLDKEVKLALSQLSDEEILRPLNDWFETTVNQLLKNTGFQRIVPNNETDVEDDYWKEHSKRENKE